VTAPFFQAYDAIATAYGTFIKPGGRVAAYVRSTGAQEGDDYFAASGLLVATIDAGVNRCRPGMNDIVLVLPGHVENIAIADAWPSIKAGAQIVSAGTPGATSNPTLTWTAVAGSLLFDVAGVSLVGFNLVLTGIADVATPIDISANAVTVACNHVTFNNGTLGAERFCQVTATGGTNFKFMNNRVVAVGETAPATGAVVGISAAAAGFTVVGNTIEAANPGSAIMGLINVAAACENILIKDNFLVQLESAATADFAISIGDQASTGVVVGNMMKLSHDVGVTAMGISPGAAANSVLYAQNFAVGVDHVSGVLAPPADS
jgi:hypothetical protein